MPAPEQPRARCPLCMRLRPLNQECLTYWWLGALKICDDCHADILRLEADMWHGDID
jgi:hypothetical protein